MRPLLGLVCFPEDVWFGRGASFPPMQAVADRYHTRCAELVFFLRSQFTVWVVERRRVCNRQIRGDVRSQRPFEVCEEISLYHRLQQLSGNRRGASRHKKSTPPGGVLCASVFLGAH